MKWIIKNPHLKIKNWEDYLTQHNSGYISANQRNVFYSIGSPMETMINTLGDVTYTIRGQSSCGAWLFNIQRDNT